MKALHEYRVSYPYGATSPPYSKSRPHRGNDRAAPCGTPVVIGRTQIGVVGTTGRSSGCHTHTQAGTDLGCQKTFNPTPLEFKPGKVVNLRTTNTGDWGKFITLKVGTKYITYAHLSRVGARVGQVIKAPQKPKYFWRTVKVPILYVRDKPTTKSKLSGSRFLIKGMRFRTSGLVKGQSVKGNNKWYKSKAGNYVWAGGVR